MTYDILKLVKGAPPPVGMVPRLPVVVRCQQPGAAYHEDWYVRRIAEEQEALERLSELGAPAILWGPAQFGKTWLLHHLLRSLDAQQHLAVQVHFSDFSEQELTSLSRLLNPL